MLQRSTHGQDTPPIVTRQEHVRMIGTCPRMPSRPAVKAPRKQAGHMTAPDQQQYSKKPLARREPSTHDGRDLHLQEARDVVAADGLGALRSHGAYNLID